MNTLRFRKLVLPFAFFQPVLAFASVDSSLKGIRTVLLSQLLPTIAGISLALAAGSFFVGSPNAKQYLIYAIIGCIILFGAQSIVSLVSETVR